MADVFAYLYGFGSSGGSPIKSTIIVTAPTGSTVTCKMGSTTKTAAEKNGVWKFGGLDLGTWTITSTKGGDSATQDVAITRLTVEYVTIVYRITPEFTYTGDYTIVDDSDNPISDFANWKNNWKIRFLTSGTLTFTKLNGWNGQLDVFLVGGGGGACGTNSGAGGGGGGYTKTVRAVQVLAGVAYQIVVGAGGKPTKDGGTSSAFNESVEGGKSNSTTTVNGGDGGSGGGARGDGSMGAGGRGGSDGSDGFRGKGNSATVGKGQKTTTREFGESANKLYSGGGAGGSTGGAAAVAGGAGGGGNGGADDGVDTAATPGETNTGGGGGGGYKPAAGGSGIVIARNARRAA